VAGELKLNLYIKDRTDGSVRRYGEDRHDALYVRNGVLEYENLQNGDGSPSGYCFCNEDGTEDRFCQTEDRFCQEGEKYVHIGRISSERADRAGVWISVSDDMPDQGSRIVCRGVNGGVFIVPCCEWVEKNGRPMVFGAGSWRGFTHWFEI